MESSTTPAYTDQGPGPEAVHGAHRELTVPAPAPTRIHAPDGAPRGGLAALCITQTTAWGVLYSALIAALRPIIDSGTPAARSLLARLRAAAVSGEASACFSIEWEWPCP